MTSKFWFWSSQHSNYFHYLTDYISWFPFSPQQSFLISNPFIIVPFQQKVQKEFPNNCCSHLNQISCDSRIAFISSVKFHAIYKRKRKMATILPWFFFSYIATAFHFASIFSLKLLREIIWHGGHSERETGWLWFLPTLVDSLWEKYNY